MACGQMGAVCLSSPGFLSYIDQCNLQNLEIKTFLFVSKVVKWVYGECCLDLGSRVEC